jgi:hypothetical protein
VLEKGNAEEAEKLALEGLEIYRRTLPEGNIKITGGESTLGHALVVQGRFREAEILLLESYQAMEAVQERAPYRIAALESLVELYEAMEKNGLASEYRARLGALETETRNH